MTVALTDLGTAVNRTLNALGKNNLTDLSAEYQNYSLTKMFDANSKMESGNSIDINILKDDNGSSALHGYYGTVNRDRSDGSAKGTVGWTRENMNMSLDEDEVAQNAEPAKIIDLVKEERQRMFMSHAGNMETWALGTPATSSDVLTPKGLKFWIQRNSSTGFNGGNPSGFTSGCAGVSTADVPRWANWTAQYTNPTRADLVALMRQGAMETKWVSPHASGIPPHGTAEKRAVVVNGTTFRSLVTVAEDNNMNFGSEIGIKDGWPTFYGTPLTWVPLLDADTTNPVYMVNFGDFKLVKLRGRWMVQRGPRTLESQPSVWAVDINNSFQFVCYNRHTQAVLYV